jgi:hypothetical protein
MKFSVTVQNEEAYLKEAMLDIAIKYIYLVSFQ